MYISIHASIYLFAHPHVKVLVPVRQACRKVPSDLTLGRQFRQVIQFPPPLKTSNSQLGRKLAESVDKTELN